MGSLHFTSIGLLGFLLLLPATVSADISRGCNAAYEMTWVLVDNAKFAKPYRATVGKFESRGRCRGKAWANDCRRDARSRALACMDAHWKQRWDRKKPGICLPHRADLGPRGYKVDDLKAGVEWQACCRRGAPSFSREARIRVRGVTWGGKRCGGSTQLSEGYRVTPQMCAAFDGKSCGH